MSPEPGQPRTSAVRATQALLTTLCEWHNGAAPARYGRARTTVVNWDFSGLDFRRMNFADATFLDCSFRQADLRRTVFHRAKLRGAEFDDADLTDGDFAEADLSRGDARPEDLRPHDPTRFVRAALCCTNFTGARLREVDFSGAYLDRTILRRADLSAARFRGAELIDVELDGAALAEADFAGAAPICAAQSAKRRTPVRSRARRWRPASRPLPDARGVSCQSSANRPRSTASPPAIARLRATPRRIMSGA